MGCINLIKKILLIILIVITWNFYDYEVKALEVTEEFINEIEDTDEFLDNDENIENVYKIYVNDEEVDNYDLVDQDIVKITRSYSDEINNCNVLDDFYLDYTNKLYGSYDYSFPLVCDGSILDTKGVTINYIGDNNKIINKNNIYYKNKNYYILGSVDKEYLVLDIKKMFNQELDKFGAYYSILNKDNEELRDNDVVTTGDKLRIRAIYEEYDNEVVIDDYFTINIIMDNNQDEKIDDIDIKDMIIKDILFGEGDKFLEQDIFMNDDIPFVEARDRLSRVVEYKDMLFIDELLEVKYYLDGFEQDTLKLVSGKINYDKEVLELVDVRVDNIGGSYNFDGEFTYLLDNYNKDGLFITFVFKGLSVGECSISLENINLVSSGGDNVYIEDALFSDDIWVLEYGKGGDVEEEQDPEVEQEYEEVITEDKVVMLDKKEDIYVFEEIESSKIIEYVSLSSDNYIKSLKIKGYDIDFDKNILEYEIEVKSDVTKLDFDILLSDNDSNYEIIGNENLKRGNNRVVIKVTSMDGSSRNYIINVKKSTEVLEEVDELEKEKITSKNIIILLIVLIIIGLIYVIFKDDNDSN